MLVITNTHVINSKAEPSVLSVWATLVVDSNIDSLTDHRSG